MSIRATFLAAVAAAALQSLAPPSLAAPSLAAPSLAAPSLAAPSLAVAGTAGVSELAGAPQYADGSSQRWEGKHWASRHMAEAPGRHEGECFAKVRYGAQYAPPPTGPEYVWRQAPPPPGAPGPIWCLTVQPMANHPVMISPERYGWIRVLCDDDATPNRIADVQRRLHERGLYRGEIDGRYDERTAWAVRRFQSQRRIEDRGYLGYDTMAALEGPPPPPPAYGYWGHPTTFDTGIITWPGKVIF